jgi:acetyl-CoA acetyltransferase
VERSITTRLAGRAYEAAGVGPDDVDVAEVYDAFTILEVLNTEGLGLAPTGTAAERIAAGAFALGTDQVVTNPGGGLLGRGHPLGATGVAQIAEITTQLQGRGGDRQVPDASIGLVHTLGGNLREIESNAGAVMILAR